MRDYRKEFWRGLEELRKSQKGTDRKIKETDGRLRETDRIIKKVGSMLSDLSFSAFMKPTISSASCQGL